MRKKTIMLSLSTPNTAFGGSYSTSLALPAEESEIQDALDKVRCEAKESPELCLSIMNIPGVDILEHMLFAKSSIDEYNFLAGLLSDLSESQMMVLNVLIREEIHLDEDKGYDLKEVINAVYAVDQAIFIPGISNDVQLGEFVIECELNEDIADVPDKVIDLLDRKKLGRIQCETDLGVFFKGNYICTATVDIEEIYDGINLPKAQCKGAGIFRILITGQKETEDETDGSKAEWLNLPIDREMVDSIAKKHGAERIEDCICLQFESVIPQIEAYYFDDMGKFDKLNHLAKLLDEMERADRIKLKAVLSTENPRTLNGVIDIAGHLGEHEMDTACFNTTQYFRSFVGKYLIPEFDRNWLQFSFDRSDGEELCESTGARLTEYGVISARGCPLYPLIMYGEKIENSKGIELEEQDMEPIQKITVEELAQMKDREGLVLQGCGGDPKEWLDRINQQLAEEGILLGGSRFEHCYVFEHDGTTNILLPFGEEQIRVGALAVWRIKTHLAFGGTWLSDYLENKGLLWDEDAPKKEAKQKPDCPLIGQDGNIFNLMGIAAKTLKQAGMEDAAREMCDRIRQSGSYDEALCVISEYVHVTSAEDTNEDDEMEEEVDEDMDMR